jgi:hypothetical protein
MDAGESLDVPASQGGRTIPPPIGQDDRHAAVGVPGVQPIAPGIAAAVEPVAELDLVGADGAAMVADGAVVASGFPRPDRRKEAFDCGLPGYWLPATGYCFSDSTATSPAKPCWRITGPQRRIRLSMISAWLCGLAASDEARSINSRLALDAEPLLASRQVRWSTASLIGSR